MNDNKKQNIYKIVMLVALTALITFIVTTMTLYNKFENGNVLSNTANVQITNERGLAGTLKEFKNVLEEKYVGEIDEDALIEGALKGYVDAVGDPYTEYLTKEEMDELMEDTSGK